MPEEKVQVNTEMDQELIEKLDVMSTEDENTRQQFLRKLVRREWARRQQMALPLDTANASPKRKQAAVAA